MYGHIDIDAVMSKINTSDDTMITDDERLEMFRKASNTLKLKSKLHHNVDNAIVHRDRYYSYMTVLSVAPATVTSTLYRRILKNSARNNVVNDYRDEYAKMRFLIAIPNRIVNHMMTEKMMNNVEAVRRECEYVEPPSDYKTTGYFFEALLREGIESQLYLYCVEQNWFSRILEYTDDIKKCVYYKRVGNTSTILDNQEKKLDTITQSLKESMHGSLVDDHAAIMLYMTSFGVNIKDILRDIQSRKIFVNNTEYDIFKDVREAFKTCMV